MLDTFKNLKQENTRGNGQMDKLILPVANNLIHTNTAMHAASSIKDLRASHAHVDIFRFLN